MSVQQVGLGQCPIHGTPILSQVGVSNSRICFACQEDAKTKTGRTVVVKESDQSAQGKVTIMDVNSKEATTADLSAQATGEVIVSLTIAALAIDPIKALLQGAYDAIDSMPPFRTLKETKQAISVQEEISKLLNPRKRKTQVIEDKPGE